MIRPPYVAFFSHFVVPTHSCQYFGHNEAELSIMRMFGGFDKAFFQEYHRNRPKSHPTSEYDKRQLLYELFHYVNHTCIFQVGISLSWSGPDPKGLLNS